MKGDFKNPGFRSRWNEYTVTLLFYLSNCFFCHYCPTKMSPSNRTDIWSNLTIFFLSFLRLKYNRLFLPSFFSFQIHSYALPCSLLNYYLFLISYFTFIWVCIYECNVHMNVIPSSHLYNGIPFSIALHPYPSNGLFCLSGFYS